MVIAACGYGPCIEIRTSHDIVGLRVCQLGFVNSGW